MEELLHYVWKHRIYPLGALYTSEGKPVEIIDAGLQNTHAGPDFFNAKIRIDGTVWAGNVEIHRRSSDWNRHGHQLDPAYESVVLHVASDIDTGVYDLKGRVIPQLCIPYPSHLEERYEELRREERYPPCHSLIPSLSGLSVHEWMASLLYERMEQKSRQVMERVEACGMNWEDAFAVTLARNFGFGLNGDVFERWGKSIPLRALDKHRDSLFQIEALFFGQAGLLEKEMPDDYYRRLQKEYLYLAHKFGLRHMEPAEWRFLRTRPGNFPHVRIAQLAWLFYRENALLSRLLEAPDAGAVREILSARTSGYWETHYMFGGLSARRARSLSAATQDLLVINTVCPFLFAYGRHRGDEEMPRRALAFLDTLRPENNRIVRRWLQCGLRAGNAGESQALIQLKKMYCDARKCLYCRIGYEYLRQG